MADIPTRGVLGPVNYALLNATGSGNTQVIAAPPANTKIRVLAVHLVTLVANTIKFQSATTDKTAGEPLAANGGIVLPFNKYGWFECAAAEALNFNQSAATTTGVNVVYQLVN